MVDRPSGNRQAENRFLAECTAFLQDEANFAVPERFVLPVIAAQSRHLRLLQSADLVASCTLAHIAGENEYSPPIFAEIRPMLASNQGRVGGVGLKIHPDLRYGNLYRWVGRDDYYVRGNVGIPYPHAGRLYDEDDGVELEPPHG